MTKGTCALTSEEEQDAKLFLSPMVQDGLVSVGQGRLQITEQGRPFLRNAAVFFDLRLRRARPAEGTKLFSSSI
jgi:oxygen-independent coproporphyrinogen-3 oxidase